MRLTKEEFSIFNITSQKQIVANDGVYLLKKVLDDEYEIKLFLLYDFYVELYCNYKLNKVLRVTPVAGKAWLSGFYMDMTHSFNFS